ncbi:cell cycle checkpoint protein RAD17 [Myripristis murdjan]|uniref:RAD17 checkpoint clamp loader component n=1 Tax=Myripristis murdjan TaxID=586833 RepID=A0A667Y1Z7_9TELE|nr:cell cycle checkpoint protein RAD17 [Myripristis murdjan]
MSKLSLGQKVAQSKVNRWVDPSFTDLSGKSALSGVRKGRQARLSKDELCGSNRSKKRRGEASTSSSTTCLDRGPPLREQDEPWVDRHTPRCQAELAVHKKKIEEVENWMRAHADTKALKGGAVLLLTGPSGCGKSATVQVLSRELGFRVQEWTNPSSVDPDVNIFDSEPAWRLNGFPSSQSAQFQDFLLRANKYNCLQMAGDGGSSDKKLILVEDFPNQFYRHPGSLHDILRRFVKTSRCPLVFIVSDSLSGDSSSRFLFPKEIQEELGISCISFNPVAPTTMMKVLVRIATLEAGKSGGRVSVPDQSVLEMLCSGSSGDIRSAINSLQFSSLPDMSLEKGLWGKKKDRSATSLGKVTSTTTMRKRKNKETKEQEEEQAIGGKDASLFLFRALGKILHCKRGNTEGAGGCHGPGLPSHLSQHHRQTLLVDPEVVVERSHMSGEFFNLYLHQNYLDFFSEVEDVVRASEYLSDADFLTADWTNRSSLGEYGPSVATRGLLHSNSTQVSVGFRPLHKPNWLLVSKKYRENSLAARSLFADFCLTPVSLQTELLPYLAKLTNPLRNQAQITFIQDVGQLPLRLSRGRLKLEVLTDKEPGLFEVNSEEEEEEEADGGQAGQGGGLPASQPRPTTGQDLEEEELLIEEYDSD